VHCVAVFCSVTVCRSCSVSKRVAGIQRSHTRTRVLQNMSRLFVWCTMARCVAVCCSAFCSVLQCVALCCIVLQCVAALQHNHHNAEMQHVAVCCSVMQYAAECSNVLQCVAGLV